MQFIQKIIKNLEDKKTPLINYFITFVFIVFLRDLLELVLFKQEMQVSTFAHFSLCFVVAYLFLALAMHVTTKESYKRIFKVLTPLFAIILTPVIIDKLINIHSNAYYLGYISIQGYTGFWHEFISMGSGQTLFGFTAGVRIEVILALILISLYLGAKKIGFIYNLITVIVCYGFIFSLSIILIILNYLARNANLDFQFTDALLINFYITLSTILSLIILYQARPHLFKIIVRQLKVNRLFHLLGLVSFGFWLALWRGQPLETLLTVLMLINGYIAAVLVWLCAIHFNNLADIKIDIITNTERPLIKNQISIQDYKNIAISFAVLSLIIASAISFASFLAIALFIALSSLYSLEPFRLKRYVFLAKFVEMLAWLAIAIFGFTILNPNVYNFPISMAYFIVFTSLATNFIDLKDTKGDAADNIKTLPVLIGDKWAKRLIGLFFVITYLAAYYFFMPNLLILALLTVFGLLQYLLINKKTYEEKYVFITYLGSFVLLWFLYAHFFIK